jgi:hypothetical protein
MPDHPGEPPRVRTVGERIDARTRERRAAAESRARRRPVDPSPPGAAPPDLRTKARLLARIAVFGVFVLALYLVLHRLTYLIFAPELEVIRTILPAEGLSAGEPVTLGVVVRNRGPAAGASFVVAVTEDVETEGPTLQVPPRDSALIPVRVTLNSGVNSVSLVVFDGWRGVRELRAFRNLAVGVEPRSLDIEVAERATRGDSLRLAIPWSNPGMTRETVLPVVVFRSDGGGPPFDQEGPPFHMEPLESRTLEFSLDTWPLRAGKYLLEVYLEAPGRERVARGKSPHLVEVSEP